MISSIDINLVEWTYNAIHVCGIDSMWNRTVLQYVE